MTILIQEDIKRLTGRVLEITLLTDRKSLFEVLTKGSVTLEKRFMINIRATRNTYVQDIIGQLGWVWRGHNLADPITKIVVSQILRDFMETGRVSCIIEQYVIKAMRTDLNTSESE